MEHVRQVTSHSQVLWRLFGLSAIGIVFFFVPISIDGNTTIPLDHLVSWIKSTFGNLINLYVLMIILAGAIMPLWTGQWRQSGGQKLFTLLKCIGAVSAFMALTKIGPAFLHEPDILPFLFNKLVVSVGVIVPVGAIFLSFLVSYGLLELIGILLQPIMRPIWRTPGRSAIDAVASFVGSYSLGLLITDKVYKNGQYSVKEATIIATGFSTVSATFMIIVARTLDLMSHWNLYFWSALIITFIVTAITVRLPPIKGLSDNVLAPEPQAIKGQRWGLAYQTGLSQAAQAGRVSHNLLATVKDGLLITMTILPAIMSVGLLGLLAAKYTPVFEWLGWIFYPITALWGLDNGHQLAQAASAGLAEMFLPALLLSEADFVLRFSAAITCVSSVLFFSASIPCILATSIPISVFRLVVIWALRTALSLMLSIPLALLIAG
jgi:nucleoside recognition membrane protein YjiH